MRIILDTDVLASGLSKAGSHASRRLEQPESALPRGADNPAALLRPGQVVMVRVLQLDPNSGRALINLLGLRLQARAKAEGLIATGQIFPALVEAATQNGEIHLRRVRINSHRRALTGTLSQIVRSLGLPEEALQVIRELTRWQLPIKRETIERILWELSRQQPGKIQSYLRVRAWVETLQVQEANSNAPRLTRFLLGNDDEVANRLLNAAEVSNLEDYSLMAFSWPGKPGRSSGRFYIASRQSKREGPWNLENPLNLVFQVLSPNLGETWFWLLLSGQDLTMKVYASSPAAADLLNSTATQLTSALGSLGYRVKLTGVSRRIIPSIIELLAEGQGVEPRHLDTSV